jgi:hypothetical protein
MLEKEFKIWLEYGLILFFDHALDGVFAYVVDDLQNNAEQYISFFRSN